ncbi:Putative Zn-dependent protease, contains TPR repeats [Monaibacterium marinum]|uniref:Zn-dependent protease, contains TPR repeats n=1 Tax=Pontivivens marinum TaxID=1690039 RepID=A0A2C9CWD6_9RHOB|nr:M48 family metalloprotease [Monaibacterium marinum]SOH95582.1 Putative Zn-dependent protease, contains TPR repeats [Monaibacterium marinum]
MSFKHTILATVAVVICALPVSAQNLIRDAEIEQTLDRMVAPLVAAAGLPRDSVDIYIVNNREMNAFVISGGRMFIHSGLIQRLDRPDMLQAVMAHEIGHIVSGHIAQRSVEAELNSRASVAGVLLGLLTAAAGAPEAGVFIARGASGAAQASLLAYSRDQESSADQSSVRILQRAGIDPVAAIDTLDLFRGQELLSTAQIDPYALTHPLSSARLDLLERQAENSSLRGTPVDPDLQDAYERMQAKFEGFSRSPQSALNRVQGRTDMPARIQRAIALHRLPAPSDAIAEIDAAIALEPRNPWLYELKGQFLFENGQAVEAVAPYRQALSLAPNAALVRAGLGQALLSVNTPDANREALQHLSQARDSIVGTPVSLRALAEAHARAGNDALAALFTAERYALGGSVSDATRFAVIARDGLPNGSPNWIRANELLSTLEQIEERRRG